MKTDADITKWLPGDIVFDEGLAIPYDIPAGKYALRVGLLSRETGKAAVQLAQGGRAADGWYELGQIEIA